jgi:pyridoxamine 5'-phosphate oxidase family protein
MRVFTQAEIESLVTQPLGRIARVGADGAPHVTPVGVFHEPEAAAIVVGAAGGTAASNTGSFEHTARDVA